LKAAQSDNLGDTVDRSAWIGLAQAHLEFARKQMDKMGDNWQGLDRETTRKWHATEKELIRAEKALDAAQSDDFERPVQRTTLLEAISEEVQFAQIRLDEAIKSQEHVELRSKVLGALSGLESVKRKLKRHKILLKWIEQQRRRIVSECAISLEEFTPRATRSAESARLQKQGNRLVESVSNVMGKGMKRGHNDDRADESSEGPISKKQKRDVGESRSTRSASVQQEEERSKRRPRDEIIERPSKRPKCNSQDSRLPHHKVSDAASRGRRGMKPTYVCQQTTLDSDKVQPHINGQINPRQTRSKQLPKPEKTMTVLQPTRASRIRKAKRLPGAQCHSGIMNSDQNSISLHKRRQKNLSQPVQPPTRRSTRIRKPPEQFCPG
jgi:hypothetical protein